MVSVSIQRGSDFPRETSWANWIPFSSCRCFSFVFFLFFFVSHQMWRFDRWINEINFLVDDEFQCESGRAFHCRSSLFEHWKSIRSRSSGAVLALIEFPLNFQSSFGAGQTWNLGWNLVGVCFFLFCSFKFKKKFPTFRPFFPSVSVGVCARETPKKKTKNKRETAGERR